MANVVEFVSFKLKEGISQAQLTTASDEFNAKFLSLQKGCLSRKLIKEGDTWADLVLWETMEDAMNAVKAFEQSEFVQSYCACIEEDGCNMRHFSIIKEY